MLRKIIALLLLFLSSSFASYEMIKVGVIDNYYENKINKQEVRNILSEIEYLFESKLNMNIFDYSENGKVIDILYIHASKLEQRLNRKLEKSKIKKLKIEKVQYSLPSKLSKINIMKQDIKNTRSILNKKIKALNDYVSIVNKQKTFPKEELIRIKDYIKKEKKKIKSFSSKFKKDERKLRTKLSSYNQKIRLQNNLIREFNILNNEIERINRNFKKVKGNAIGIKQVTSKIFYKDGKRVKEKSVNNIMNKIEIYGFDNKQELKVILAHEIAHLVGIPHINVKDALMNPILQKSQINKLTLTKSDIINFKKNF